MKTTADIRRMVEALPPEKREQVEAIVRRHLAACHRLGVTPDAMDRVWIEAMEAIRLDEQFTEKMDEKWPEWNALWRYDVYEAPRADF
jgi:hypothetical protein